MSVEQKRALVTEIPGPRSLELQERKAAAVAAGVGTTLPVYVERAGGGIVVDVDGNQLIDFGAGIAVVSVGNAAPAGGRGGARAGRRLHPHLLHGHAVRGVRRRCREAERADSRSSRQAHGLFNSGAEAVENAVKIARHHTGRQAVVAFDHAYHGRTNLTMALTAKNMPYKHRFGPFANEIYRVPMAYPYRWPTGRRTMCRRGVRPVRLDSCTRRSAKRTPPP